MCFLLLSSELLLAKLGKRSGGNVLELFDRAEFLATMLENSQQPFAVADPDGRFGFFNKAFLQMLGYTKEEMTEKNWYREITAPEWVEPEQVFLRELDRTGTPVRYEKEYLHKSSRRFPVELLVHLQRTPDGKIDFYYAFITDITERKRSEKTLRESEERFKLAMDVSKDGIWDWNVTTGDVYYSPAYTAMLGYLSHELPPHVNSWADLIHPLDKEAAFKANMDCIENCCEEFNVEFRMQAVDGNWHWIMGRGKAVERDSTGRAIRMVGTHTDITMRRQAQEALATKDALLGAMLRNLPFDFWARDVNQRVIMQSDESIRRWGELALTALDEADVAPEYKEYWLSNNNQILEGKTISVEKEYLVSDCEPQYFHEIIAPIREADKILGILGINIDITKYKQTEEKLRKAKEVADAANTAKSEFLANMSHEVRTPLNGIMGMLQILLLKCTDEEQREYIQTAMGSSRQLTDLLSDILDLSRIEAGKLIIHETPFAVADVVLSVREIFHTVVEKKKLKLTISIDEQIPRNLVGDPARLRQILFNLIGNALKFTEEGGVNLAVSLESPSYDDAIKIIFCVSDTGVGIPADRLDAIFEPFTQADSSSVRAYQGVGLGLTIVRRLISLMLGEIEMNSRVGEGTSVRVILPFALGSDVQKDGGESSKDAIGPTPLLTHGQLHLLLVEDEAINLLSMKMLMSTEGHYVATARNGEQALELLTKENFDLILMDVQMPVMDGLEATRIIRTSPEFSAKSQVPIIALTAYAMTGDEEKFLEAGMDGYISKPFDLAELKEAIKRVMILKTNASDVSV